MLFSPGMLGPPKPSPGADPWRASLMASRAFRTPVASLSVLPVPAMCMKRMRGWSNEKWLCRGRDVQAVAERSVHRGAHLVLRQRQVAHHESLVAAALECGPGREPLERLHLDAVHRDPEVRARCGHLRHPVLHLRLKSREPADHVDVGTRGGGGA